MIGTDAFQETPIVEVTRQITKHNYLVMDIADLPRVMKEVRTLSCRPSLVSGGDFYLLIRWNRLLLLGSCISAVWQMSMRLSDWAGVPPGFLPGKDWAAGASAGGCAQGRAAAARGAGLGRGHGHQRLHEPPAPAAPPGAGLRRH